MPEPPESAPSGPRQRGLNRYCPIRDLSDQIGPNRHCPYRSGSNQSRPKRDDSILDAEGIEALAGKILAADGTDGRQLHEEPLTGESNAPLPPSFTLPSAPPAPVVSGPRLWVMAWLCCLFGILGLLLACTAVSGGHNVSEPFRGTAFLAVMGGMLSVGGLVWPRCVNGRPQQVEPTLGLIGNLTVLMLLGLIVLTYLSD